MPRILISARNTFLLTILAIGTLCGAGFKAGVAKVDITPPPGLPMYGYFDRTQLSKGTLDPLYARVLVLEVERKRLAMVGRGLPHFCRLKASVKVKRRRARVTPT